MTEQQAREVAAMGELTTTDDGVLVRVWDEFLNYLGTYEEVFGG